MSNLQEAADLLSKPLIWSGDLDLIRHHLACILEAIDQGKDPEIFAQDLALDLLDDFHTDLRIG
jgi:hypothetical protein